MKKTSAPGKAILFGEHSVVYPTVEFPDTGRHFGIVGAIDRRTFSTAKLNGKDVVNISTGFSNVSVGKEELDNLYKKFSKISSDPSVGELKEIYIRDKTAPVKLVLGEIFHEYGFEGMDISIESEIPNNSHLGSSSSVFASIAAAVLSERGERLNDRLKKKISDLAFHGDMLVVGTPSGIDNSAVVYGGWLKYTKLRAKGDGLKGRVDLLDKIGSIKIAVGDSAKYSDTGKMVGGLSRHFKKRPEDLKYLDDINEIASEGLGCLKSGDLKCLGRLMDQNNEILLKLHLSCDSIECLRKIAREAGAYGSKLTGAGGGGCIIAVAEKPEKIVEAWKNKGFKAFVSVLGSEGVRNETNELTGLDKTSKNNKGRSRL